MSDAQTATPGGYFVGRPVNSDAPEKEPVVEQAPVNDNIPGDYFVGPPANQQPKPAAQAAKPSFLAQCCPCLSGGAAAS